MRNSSLVECVLAPTIHRGSSLVPKPWLLTFPFSFLSLIPIGLRASLIIRKKKERAYEVRRVGERSGDLRSLTARRGGDNGRENAGMSSALHVKIMHTVSLRVPKQGLSTSGQSGLRRILGEKPMDNRFIFLYQCQSLRAMGGRRRLGAET